MASLICIELIPVWFSIVKKSTNFLYIIREVKNLITDFKHDGCDPSYPFGVRWATHIPKKIEINTTNLIFIVFEKYFGTILAITSCSTIKLKNNFIMFGFCKISDLKLEGPTCPGLPYRSVPLQQFQRKTVNKFTFLYLLW